jgi:small subunit ribosomal protein S13
MVRLVGVDLPAGKNIKTALTYIFGVGLARSLNILQETGINPLTATKDLTEAEVVALRDVLGQHRLEGDLRKDTAMDIRRLMDISAYRGIRHRRGLPVRGQRTRTNARTKRGKRKTVGLGKREEEKKDE